MFTIDIADRTPLFLQLVNKTEEYVRIGVLKPGDRLPSVRKLTAEIGINPNTIQKAYDELSSRGIVESAAGRGSFITKNSVEILRERARKRLPELTELVRELHSSGLDGEEIRKTVEEALQK